MSRYSLSKLYVTPDSQSDIAERARGLLIRGDCLGVLPTPIEHLYGVADVEEVEIDRGEAATIFGRFSEAARNLVSDVLSKVRGAADLKKRVVFMPRDDSPPRILFARAHELGHQTLPWHYLNQQYLDDDRTLGQRIKARFEVEANLFAAETIFQGVRFGRIAREYRPEFASVFDLGRMHGASKHATFWRFVQFHDEAIAGLIYYPTSTQADFQGREWGFVCQNEVRSKVFSDRYAGLTFDARLELQHPWGQARFKEVQPVSGAIMLMVDGRYEEFLWEAFWNGYCLMVIIRRRPPFRLVGSLLRRVQVPSTN